MRRGSRRPRRRERRAPRDRRSPSSRAAAGAMRARAARAAARAPPKGGDGPATAGPPLRMPGMSTLDVSPGLLPLQIVHAVALAVPTVLRGCLPELDRVEIGRGGICVVLRAGPLRELV